MTRHVVRKLFVENAQSLHTSSLLVKSLSLSLSLLLLLLLLLRGMSLSLSLSLSLSPSLSMSPCSTLPKLSAGLETAGRRQ